MRHLIIVLAFVVGCSSAESQDPGVEDAAHPADARPHEDAAHLEDAGPPPSVDAHPADAGPPPGCTKHSYCYQQFGPYTNKRAWLCTGDASPPDQCDTFPDCCTSEVSGGKPGLCSPAECYMPAATGTPGLWCC